MFEGHITINNKKIPQASLGTAPFVAATYFGHRSRLYELDFSRRPENILKIIKKSYDRGIRAIQVIPEDQVIGALKMALDEGIELDIWGTIRKDHFKKDITTFADLNASIMLLDEWLTDKSEINLVKSILDRINDENAVAGLITALPMETTPKIIDSPLKDLFDIYMVPVNKLGYMMDYDAFMKEERADLEKNLKKLDKVVMANKILAAGILTPEEAFEFLKTLDYVDMVTLGVASEIEAEKTFDLLFNE